MLTAILSRSTVLDTEEWRGGNSSEALIGASEAGDVATTRRALALEAASAATAPMCPCRTSLCKATLLALTVPISRARCGVDPNQCLGLGNYTPLHHACSRGHAEVVRLLLAAGARADAVTESGDTCVHLSAYQGSPTIMEMLLGYDGESFGYRCVNAKNENGETALMLACRKGHSVVAKLLIARGADVTLVDRVGDTAEDQIADGDAATRAVCKTSRRFVVGPLALLPWSCTVTILQFCGRPELGRVTCTWARWRRIMESDGSPLLARFGKAGRWQQSLTATLGFGVSPMSSYRPPGRPIVRKHSVDGMKAGLSASGSGSKSAGIRRSGSGSAGPDGHW